ncbi:MAG: hypothetical protein Ct9H90mP9_1540 [Pseudomonadota bacterium]|nr:MAG: hypothetical protein Ct9H90mP9_1540 [Pseudomonadota bacterium]
MGAHKAIPVLYEEGQTDSFGYAKIMAKVWKAEIRPDSHWKAGTGTDAGFTASMWPNFLISPSTNIIRFSDLAVME